MEIFMVILPIWLHTKKIYAWDAYLSVEVVDWFSFWTFWNFKNRLSYLYLSICVYFFHSSGKQLYFNPNEQKIFFNNVQIFQFNFCKIE
jgi:hypothetical protein